MKVEDKLYGYTNYPRKCPICKEFAHWEFVKNVGKKELHDTINKCKNCNVKLIMKTKSVEAIYYDKPVRIIENSKWEIIK